MEEVLRRENLIEAHKRVRRNKGAPGVDGMTVDELMPYCRKHWEEIRGQLLDETYKPRPMRAVEISKPNGGTRMLGIPVVLDRLIMQALLQVLTPIFDPTFSESSHGYRPGRCTHDAVRRAREYVTEGYDWAVILDLEKFFDRVNHDVLMSRVVRKVKDKRVLRLIRRYLQAGIMTDGLSSPRTEGTPQGSPLSPLLSNILLDELDKELEARGHRFCRYADDVSVFVKSEAAGKRVLASLEKFLSKRLRLKVNREKSVVTRPWESVILGYSFSDEPRPKTLVSPKSVKRLKQKLKPVWKRGRGQSVKMTIVTLNRIIIGWASYFRLSERDWVFKKLDGWIRRRIRWIIWRQWKRPRTRLKKLRQLGVPGHVARAIAYSNVGPWNASKQVGMHIAFPNNALKQMGLRSLLDEYRRFEHSM
ncbi:MAG: group II intron reverse transcriptase/maturase [Proteobacteria bacterium]|nr:group II intron reverse transcriptase/maturase [Pseudomonadota bacterium]